MKMKTPEHIEKLRAAGKAWARRTGKATQLWNALAAKARRKKG